MQKFHGCKPAGMNRQAVEKFETKGVIRQDHRVPDGTVYPDMQETACFMKDC